MKYVILLQRKKVIIIVVALLVFLLVGGWYGQRTRKSSPPSAVNKEDLAKPSAAPLNKYSRISFFLKSPVNGSLAIPEYWEGKYRTREEGNKINLIFTNDPNLESVILYIKYYSTKEWDEIAKSAQIKEKEIERKDGLAYVYYIAEDNPYTGENQNYFKNMTAEAAQIIKSLRLFSNN